MNPKKIKSYINIISEDLKEDVDLLECRNVLSTLKYNRLNIDGLGHFKSRNNLIKKSIDKINKDLNGHDTSTFKAYYNKKNLEDKLKLLTNLVDLSNIETKRKNKFKQEKNESKKHLEE